LKVEGLKELKKKMGTQKKENERKTKNNGLLKLSLKGMVKA
jgi:hypothetical protein